MERYRPLLKNLNLKVTPKRMAILDALAEEPRYVGPEEVWQKLQGKLDRIGLPTVYRNLEDLADGGVITKIIHPNRQLYYYFCETEGHHHHFICLSCRKVEDIDGCVLEQVEREVSSRLRGEVTSHILQVNGFCSECAPSGDRA